LFAQLTEAIVAVLQAVLQKIEKPISQLSCLVDNVPSETFRQAVLSVKRNSGTQGCYRHEAQNSFGRLRQESAEGSSAQE
jgi:hypothetical protein